MTSFDATNTETITSPAKLDHLLTEHITHYVNQYSFVKLEAALTQMVYEQFQPHYQQTTNSDRIGLEKQIGKYIPTRHQIRAFLDGEPICFRRANTLANFFHIPYTLFNHDPTLEFS